MEVAGSGLVEVKCPMCTCAAVRRKPSSGPKRQKEDELTYSAFLLTTEPRPVHTVARDLLFGPSEADVKLL